MNCNWSGITCDDQTDKIEFRSVLIDNERVAHRVAHRVAIVTVVLIFFCAITNKSRLLKITGAENILLNHLRRNNMQISAGFSC